jgi:hypothetical protein
MRRPLAAALLAASLLAGAGCSAGEPGGSADRPAASAPAPGAPVAPGASAPTGATTGPAPTDTAPAGGNGRQVCDAATGAGATAVRTYVEELGRMVAASGAGDTRGAEAARRRAEAALAGWRTALTAQSRRATDARLGALLTELAAEVGTLTVGLDSVDETALDRLQQRLDQLCAG